MVGIRIGGNLLDVGEGEELDVVLNKSISDFDDASARNSLFSFDFKLPPTPNNTKLLFGVSDVNAIFEIGRQTAELVIDGRTYDRGQIFAYESELNGNYTCTYQSGLIDWATELDKVKLNTLEWEAETNSGTVTATESFTNSRINTLNGLDYSGGNDLIYPIINRNNGLELSAKRPVIYLRSLIERMFSKIGWTVDGSFLTDDEITGGTTVNDKFGSPFDFKGVVYDAPFNFEVDDEIVTASSVGQSTDRNQDGTFPSTWDTDYVLGTKIGTPNINLLRNFAGWYNENISGDFTNYNVDGNLFTAPRTSKYTVTVDMGQCEWGYYSGTTYGWRTLTYGLDPNITVPPEIIVNAYVNSVLVYSQPTSDPMGKLVNSHQFELSLNDGDELLVGLGILDTARGFGASTDLDAPSLPYWSFKLGDDSSLKVELDSQIDIGETFVINGHLPDTNCLEILKDLKICFNLMFKTNPLLKKVTIDSWNDFYQDIGQAENYTNKVDLDVAPTINHLSTYSKDVSFMYDPDSDDGYLERWEKIYDRTYGKYRQELIPRDKFNDGENEFKTALIAPTVQGFLNGVAVPTSIIKKEWADDDDVAVNVGYAPRIYYALSGAIRDNTGTPITGGTVVVGMMESFGNVPIPNDWQLTFNGANGLVARKWAKTLATIQLGIRVKLNLLISKDIFFQFNFAKPIFLEYPTKIKGYYLVESLNEYKLTDGNKYSVKATLIKYRDFAGVEIDTSQSTNINADNTTLPDGNDVDIVYTITDEGLPTETINRVYTIAASGNINRVII